jgi:hypothetical protein
MASTRAAGASGCRGTAPFGRGDVRHLSHPAATAVELAEGHALDAAQTLPGAAAAWRVSVSRLYSFITVAVESRRRPGDFFIVEKHGPGFTPRPRFVVMMTTYKWPRVGTGPRTWECSRSSG